MPDILRNLLESLDMEPGQIIPVQGGDINDSFRLTGVEDSHWFVKINRPDQPKEIITTEYHGLEMMRSAGVRMLPREIRYAEYSDFACLIMPYDEKPDRIGRSDWADYVRHLAGMHLTSRAVFGGEDNFIGSLPQVNTAKNNWISVYRENRLAPQWERARVAELISSRYTSNWHRFLNRLPDVMPVERPALVHGDLWSGNVLITREGIMLIDPCPYFGHREMDLAMMQLFSGVPVQEFLNEYENIYPLSPGLADRIGCYQLYYLLVHLNLFGATYFPAVRRIIESFS